MKQKRIISLIGIYAVVMGSLMVAGWACSSFRTNPETGETEFSAEGAALDTRTLAIVAEEAIPVWQETSPEVAEQLAGIAAKLNQLAVVFDSIAEGGEIDPTQYINTLLAALDSLNQQFTDDPETRQRLSATIATISIGLRVYQLRYQQTQEG